MLKVGVIGFGSRIVPLVKSLIELYHNEVEIAAINDIKSFEEISEICKSINIDLQENQYFNDLEKMLDTVVLDGIFIGTRCFLHTKLALKIIPKDLAVFLEKPVSTTLNEVNELSKLCSQYDNNVVVSFPLRVSPMVKKAKEIIDSGILGEISHISAFNYVPYGGVYYHNWYRDDKETGGLFLQKATHDLDYINYLFTKKPVLITAMASKQVFKGNKQANLKCNDCDEYKSCTESPFVLSNFYGENPTGDYCCFATDTGNQDSGSILIKYENGTHAVYTQNFFARKKAAKRGAILSGYNGTLEFDWYTDEIKVYNHQQDITQTYKFNQRDVTHFGGDKYLLLNFVQIMKKSAMSNSPLSSGVLSAKMCILAQKSSDNNSYEMIEY